MSPAEATARQLVADLAGIVRRNGSVLQRFQAIEDRVFEGERALAAIPAPKPSCDCGEADCKRGVCR